MFRLSRIFDERSGIIRGVKKMGFRDALRFQKHPRVASSRYETWLLCIILWTVVFSGGPVSGSAWAQEMPIKIGVLAILGPQECQAKWGPTAGYLSRWFADRLFIIIPLTHDQVYSQVEKGAVDFVLVNSALYVGLELKYNANRIVTLKELREGGAYKKYGGVIFCRKDRGDIRTPKDLKGKSFMAVSETSLGGWLAAWRELKEKGVEPRRDFTKLLFGETHDRVVEAVRDGVVDAGAVRTNVMEELSAEGKIDLDDFYIFPNLSPNAEPTPYFCSTREYPEWPMAKVQHTPDELAEQVAVALLQMRPDSEAAMAAGCEGWTIPLNYQPVRDCLKALRVGPYEDVGKITFADVLRNYGYWIFFACMAFCILAFFTAEVVKLNRRLKTSHLRLKEEMELVKEMDRRLTQAKEEAESATRAKSEFLANMSHEIRTPMNGVIAAADLAMGEELTPKTAHYLQIIHRSAYSLLSIINDILDFSKIEAGKFELKDRVFRLNETIDRVMEMFVKRAAEKGIEMLVDIDPDTPKVVTSDPLRLQQILTNLVSNAVKFTEAGGVVLLHVGQAKPPAAGLGPNEAVLVFSVKDTGAGIPPKYIDRLFEPFSQADTSSTRKYEGTGLGLSICKQLVAMMGGDIGVESKLGQGSTFFFTVRLRRPVGRPAPKPVIPRDLQGLNVLVVDDLADSRTIMRHMLESLGFRVETLGSGPEALDRLKDNMLRATPIELIMMDWKMPEMDGFEVSRKIRQELKLAVPIIMMTAFGQEEQRIAAEAAGIDGFLTKPIYPSTLFDAVMDAFGKESTKEGGRKRRFTTRASIYRKPLKGLRILVAEDNPTNQEVAEAILEGAGIVVTIVGNGEAAVEAVRTRSFDAVLMDIQMPVMNGYEATRLIRELPQGKDLPIVAMTAHAMKGDEEKCLDAGMDGYVAKPVDQDRLFHTLWRLLRYSKGLPETDTPEEELRAETGADQAAFPEEERTGAAEVSAEKGAALPDRLPGIDIENTLVAMNIDPITVKRILIGFRSDNRHTAEKIRQACGENDLQALRQLAHSLKGSAASIGAEELKEAARVLENGCQQGAVAAGERPDLDVKIAKLEAALDLVLSSIRSLDESAAGMRVPEPVPAEACLPLDTVMVQLAEALEQADPEPINQLMPVLRQAAVRCTDADGSSLRTLEDQINRYDYDQAMETIRKIRQDRQEEA